jgi:hypothetical protein
MAYSRVVYGGGKGRDKSCAVLDLAAEIGEFFTELKWIVETI